MWINTMYTVITLTLAVLATVWYTSYAQSAQIRITPRCWAFTEGVDEWKKDLTISIESLKDMKIVEGDFHVVVTDNPDRVGQTEGLSSFAYFSKPNVEGAYIISSVKEANADAKIIFGDKAIVACYGNSQEIPNIEGGSRQFLTSDTGPGT